MDDDAINLADQIPSGPGQNSTRPNSIPFHLFTPAFLDHILRSSGSWITPDRGADLLRILNGTVTQSFLCQPNHTKPVDGYAGHGPRDREEDMDTRQDGWRWIERLTSVTGLKG